MFHRVTLRTSRHLAVALALALLLATAATGARAQDSDAIPSPMGAFRSADAPNRALVISPRVSVTETVTSNVRLAPKGQAQSDEITELNPGININIEGPRLKTYFDYSVDELAYAQNTSARHTLRNLNSYGTLEAIDNWAYLDFSGSISQQAISAFGTQSTSAASINANQTEVSTYRISPYLRGRLGDVATYDARLSGSVSRSAAGSASNVNNSDGALKISSNRVGTGLSWSIDATHDAADYSAARSTSADRLNLTLPYAITPQFSVSIDGGKESNNYTSINQKRYGTGGFGVVWMPSDLTKFSASRDRRSFGESHQVSFESRTARTVWKFSDTQDATTSTGQGGVSSSLYGLLFSQFASAQPDPIARAQMVNAFLQANGLAPTTVVTSGFLTSTLSLQHQQSLSFALMGVRDTITFVATRTQTSALDALSSVVGDLANATLVNQRGFSANLAHRLTPNYSLGVFASEQVSTGSAATQETRLKSLNVNLTGKVGNNAAFTLGARRVVSSGATPYVESAVTGNLNVPF
jgi:uncharacterized protein (PEP-CTERM system associated)